MSDPAKRALRKSAAATRDAAAREGARPPAIANLLKALGPGPGVVALYLPMRSEIDPRPAAPILIARGWACCAPVVARKAAPLVFRRWAPGCALSEGAYGEMIPARDDQVAPTALIAPLLAFDRRGFRLGYGGGFYDRTLAGLRAEGGVRAIGFAFAEQEVEAVPTDAFDQRLDLIVTDRAVIAPEPS